MKKIVAIVLVVLCIGALLCACGDGPVKTSVNPGYDDGFAKSYANDYSTDKDGNIQYQFSKEKYDKFIRDYNDKVRTECADILGEKSAQYQYLSDDGKEYNVGIIPEHYQEIGEEVAKKQAEAMGQILLKYSQSTEKPVDTIKVTFKNANTGEVYFSIDCKAK